MHKADGSEKMTAVYITIMFESPSFAPGGIKGNCGISPSINEKVIQSADKIPKNAILYE